MRKTLLLILWLGCCATCSAQLLYEISGNKAHGKSYILATHRLLNQSYIDSIPNAFKAFGRCRCVLTEFAFEDYEALAALRQAALLPDRVRLRDIYTDEEYRLIDGALREYLGMPLDELGRMKPQYLTEMFRTELFRRWLGYDDKRSMETFFEQVAQENNMPVHGLDNVGETIYMMFDREPFQWQCSELKNVVSYPERELNQEREILRAYRRGLLSDISYLMYCPDNQSTVSYSDYKVYCARNEAWVRKLKPYLEEGPCFITLNAIYLGGEKGLLQQLREAGYRVRAVKNRLR